MITSLCAVYTWWQFLRFKVSICLSRPWGLITKDAEDSLILFPRDAGARRNCVWTTSEEPWPKDLIPKCVAGEEVRFSSPINAPFQFIVSPGGEGGALDDLSHLLTTEAEVVDGPHVGELHHFDLKKKRIISRSPLQATFILRSGYATSSFIW